MWHTVHKFSLEMEAGAAEISEGGSCPGVFVSAGLFNFLIGRGGRLDFRLC